MRATRRGPNVRRTLCALTVASGLVLCGGAPVGAGAPRRPAARLAPAPPRPEAQAAPKATPVELLSAAFEPNRGQAPSSAAFVAGDALLGPTGVALRGGGKPAALEFVGASPVARLVGVDDLPGKRNYLRGADPSRWQIDVPSFAKVRCEGAYPGVDVVYYRRGGRLEYDVVVAPGADPSAVSFRVDGAPDPEIAEDGALVAGDVRLDRPFAYQEVDGARRAVASGYVLRADGRVAFRVGDYDRSRPLVVDPSIAYTFDFADPNEDFSIYGVAADANGAAYVVGRVRTEGAGGVLTVDVYVAKVNPEGTALEYTTVVGGSDQDQGAAIAVDAAGAAFLTGTTYSGDFPVTPNAFQRTNAQPKRIDAFVAKIAPDGGSLVYASYLGGGEIETGNAIAVDGAGDAYVAGGTFSTDFPTTTPSQPASAGRNDAFLTEVNASGSAKVYSTYLGGSLDDTGLGVSVDSAGDAYVVGNTFSADFPTTAGALQPASGGGVLDAWWAKYDPTDGRVASTYLGGSGNDTARGVAVDSDGNSFVTGDTSSADFPVVQPVRPALAGPGDAFVAELNAAGEALVFSTFYGGTQFDQGNAIATDGSGTVFVVGDAYSSDFPTVDPVQPAYGGGLADPFLLELDAGAAAADAKTPRAPSLAVSTLLGGANADFGTGAALGPRGQVLVAVDMPGLDTSDMEKDKGEVKAVTTDVEPAPDLAVRLDTLESTDGFDVLFDVHVELASLKTCGASAVHGARFGIDVPAGLEATSVFSTVNGVKVVSQPGEPGRAGQAIFEFAGDISFPGSEGELVSYGEVYLVPAAGSDVGKTTLHGFASPLDGARECSRANNETTVTVNFAGVTVRLGSKQLEIEATGEPPRATRAGAPPSVTLTNNLASAGSPNRHSAFELAPAGGFKVYASTQPNVQPVTANLFASVLPGVTTVDVTSAPAGSFFVVTAVTGSTESPPSNEVGGVLPEIGSLKLSAAKIVARGTGFASDVRVSFGGLGFVSAPKLKSANTKVVQKGLLATGQTIGQLTSMSLKPGATVVVVFMNGNGNGVAVEYTK